MAHQFGKDTALIIVDVQNDFCPGGSLAVPEGDAIIPVINQLIPKFQTVITTQDWHPEDHFSFADQPNFTDQSWPQHCIAETEGAQLHPALHFPEKVLTILKGTDKNKEAYSGFQDTNLLEQLKTRNISEVFVCGLATDYCVKATAIDAARSGLKTFVITNASQGVNIPEGSVQEAFNAMKAEGVELVSSQEIS